MPLSIEIENVPFAVAARYGDDPLRFDQALQGGVLGRSEQSRKPHVVLVSDGALFRIGEPEWVSLFQLELVGLLEEEGKKGISLHGFKIGLLKILYFGNPTLLDKSIMKRMIGVCPKVFVVVEMDGQPKGMRILRTDLAANTEVFTGYFDKFLQGREKISFLRRTRGMLKSKGYGVFHGKRRVTNAC